ncbi:GntR family transcriptional regulator [Mycolicibacterium hippocampi]|uniref:GntR family transcriptional regulator n=2 Tax=Mycolicibacterium hippocampi TaxID=659824 RepID=A0A7I9ZSM9_9MYCO|nr:GntR family transcriptional regulator [Mycolicibacterium hippocampi]
MGGRGPAQAPLARRSSGELVAERLRKQIITGELGPGERLNQEDIAAQLGTSRVPVREALVILEQEGWVKMEMQRGGFVLPIDTSVADNAEIWDLVFGLVARRAVERMTPDVASALTELAGELNATDDSEAVSTLCERYLDVLFEVANAPAVARTVRRTRATAIDTFFGVAPETIELSRSGTLAVIDAVLAGDSERANAAHREMQRDCLDVLMKVFENRA